MSDRKNIIVPPEVLAILQEMLRKGKDVKVSAQKGQIILREVTENNKCVVTTV